MQVHGMLDSSTPAREVCDLAAKLQCALGGVAAALPAVLEGCRPSTEARQHWLPAGILCGARAEQRWHLACHGWLPFCSGQTLHRHKQMMH